jgi:hypothetical protein
VIVEASVDVPGYREEAYFIDTTGFDGMVEFEYEYEAVFKILATRGGNPFTHIGCGFISLSQILRFSQRSFCFLTTLATLVANL